MATFETRINLRGQPTEYVRIETGVDVVHRASTAEDRVTYQSAYRAFIEYKPPAPVAEAEVKPEAESPSLLSRALSALTASPDEPEENSLDELEKTPIQGHPASTKKKKK